ncbi:DUF262 domain-containing protein [Erythrobacter litoralis]|uniref:DUF262 domain-containing protein n=1 Tax=Erythrobacter litoralis TaxID=39960 RepID=UPI0024360DF0|nr:DUF262 domain-containing protein [Erythrobacter litoralis]MDG6079022.1 DUF262 domain-containing protein [Erythrobacter litoralis]
MKIKHTRKSVAALHGEKENIDLSPMWQRGVAWTPHKQVLLIDSILRGMDIPKIYFRANTRDALRFDVVDGQQRLRAIWGFVEGEFPLRSSQTLAPIEGEEVQNKFFSELSDKLRRRLRRFKISLATISETPTQDITLLFARLQLAAPLNSAELRNAILCKMRHEVDATALTHRFFDECRIPSRRMKHQDYTAHVYALAHNGTERDLKAPDLRDLYVDSTDMAPAEVAALSARVAEALEVLADVNEATNYRIKQKWIFCDLVYFILTTLGAGQNIDADELSELYVDFDSRRLEFNRTPEELLEGTPDQDDEDLYNYIQAFRVEGGKRENVRVRSAVVARAMEGSVV